MTRWLLNSTIPDQVMSPSLEDKDARICEVVGTAVIEECPNCKRAGPMDALVLGPGDMWPNYAVVCGDKGCGVWWALVAAFPPQTQWRSDVDA